MRERRGLDRPDDLCSGPGKLTQALGVDGADHERDLCASKTVGFRGTPGAVSAVADLRIGITRSPHHLWRFLAPGNPHVSVPLRKTAS
jgi:DNA-3-methyladenine glycosylase